MTNGNVFPQSVKRLRLDQPKMLPSKVLISGILTMLLVVGVSSHLASIQSRSKLASDASAQTMGNSSSKPYYVVGSWSGDGIVAIDSSSGSIQTTFKTFDSPSAALSQDNSTLYVFHTDFDNVRLGGDSKHLFSAYDVTTGRVLWQTEIMGWRVPYEASRIWLSGDSKYAYLTMGATSGQADPVFVSVDLATHVVTNQLRVTLPYDSRLYWPRFWKMPWSDQVVLISYDKLVLADLSRGTINQVGTLPSFDNEWTRARIPKTLDQRIQVIAGDIAERSRRLYIATTAQEILEVNLAEEFQIKHLYSLPEGSQLTDRKSLLPTADGQSLYLSVQQTSSINAAGEVWLLDTTLQSKQPIAVIKDQPASALTLDSDGQLITFGSSISKVPSKATSVEAAGSTDGQSTTQELVLPDKFMATDVIVSH